MYPRSKYVIDRRRNLDEKKYPQNAVWINPQLVNKANDVPANPAPVNPGGSIKSKYCINNIPSTRPSTTGPAKMSTPNRARNYKICNKKTLAASKLSNCLLQKKKQLLNQYLETMKSASAIAERFENGHPQRVKTCETLESLKTTIDKLKKEIDEETIVQKSNSEALPDEIEDMLDELDDDIPSSTSIIDQKPTLRLNLMQKCLYADETLKFLEDSMSIQKPVIIDLKDDEEDI